MLALPARRYEQVDLAPDIQTTGMACSSLERSTRPPAPQDLGTEDYRDPWPISPFDY
jgi:hypothetical protein